MLKYFTFSFVLLLSLASPVFSGGNSEKLVSECFSPTIMVMGQGRYGSGFVVRSELVGEKYRNAAVTCWHITEGEQVFFVRVMKYDSYGKLMGYTRYPATLYAKSEDKDLVVLLFESTDKIPVAKLAPFDCKLRLNEFVRKIGFAMADDPCMDEGRITSVFTRSPENLKGFIRANTEIIPGDSGGPLFNKRNQVIGVSVIFRISGFEAIRNRSYYVPMSWFKTWDDGLNNALAFVYNRQEKMPVMAFTTLRLKYYEPVGEKKNAFLCPTRQLFASR